MEACLQCCLLESGLLSQRAVFQLVPRAENVCRVAEYLPVNFVLGESVLNEFDLRKMLREYFRFLLPWLKKNNNVMRHHVNYMVKYFAFFSAEFVSVYYGDKVYRTSDKVSSSSGTVRATHNLNLRFLGSRMILEGLDVVAETIPTWILDMRKLAKLFIWLEFSPTSEDQIRLLGLILSLPIMGGGYGRADKYLLAPKSAVDQEIGDHISKAFSQRIRLLHSRAVSNKIMPIDEETWFRGSIGFMKSTSAADRVKVPISDFDRSREMKSSGVGTKEMKEMVLSTKAIVGLVRGMKTFHSDMERTFDTPRTALSSGNRDVPVKGKLLRLTRAVS